jgi:hypothetical protein
VVIEELKNRKVIEKEKCKIAEVLFSNHFKCKWITCFSQKIDIDEMGLKKKNYGPSWAWAWWSMCCNSST